jgi:hypothetical protein
VVSVTQQNHRELRYDHSLLVVTPPRLASHSSRSVSRKMAAPMKMKSIHVTAAVMSAECSTNHGTASLETLVVRPRRMTCLTNIVRCQFIKSITAPPAIEMTYWIKQKKI